MWVTSHTKSVGWDLSSWVWTGKLRFRQLGEVRRLCALRAQRVGCKSSQHRKIVSLSPHVEKPLNSKRWIKVSYLNQFRECRVFRIPFVYFTYPYRGYVTRGQKFINPFVSETKEPLFISVYLSVSAFLLLLLTSPNRYDMIQHRWLREHYYSGYVSSVLDVIQINSLLDLYSKLYFSLNQIMRMIVSCFLNALH